jgi:hypothetical protein
MALSLETDDVGFIGTKQLDREAEATRRRAVRVFIFLCSGRCCKVAVKFIFMSGTTWNLLRDGTKNNELLRCRVAPGDGTI